MESSEINGIDPVLRDARAKLLARVYAIILSPDWGEPDEPVIVPARQRRPSKCKQRRSD